MERKINCDRPYYYLIRFVVCHLSQIRWLWCGDAGKWKVNQCNSSRVHLRWGIHLKKGKVDSRPDYSGPDLPEVTGPLLLLSPAIICHLWAVLALLRHWSLSVEPALLHNLAVAPATHQPGSGELHGCSAEIDKNCVWAFRGRNVWPRSFMINEKGNVFIRWIQALILASGMWNKC